MNDLSSFVSAQFGHRSSSAAIRRIEKSGRRYTEHKKLVEEMSEVKQRLVQIEHLVAGLPLEEMSEVKQRLVQIEHLVAGLPLPEPSLANIGPKPPTMRAITEEVCQKFGLTLLQIRSRVRARKIVWPRQEAIYRCRYETPNSLTAIGNFFGLDHSTVMHAIAAHQARLDAENAQS